MKRLVQKLACRAIITALMFPGIAFGAGVQDREVIIVPVGTVQADILEDLKEVLTDRFDLDFTIIEPIQVPANAYNPERRQFYSGDILEYLSGTYDNKKVLAVIDEDLYVPELNFIFGQAEIPGRCAIISLTRLRQTYYGLPEDEAAFFERVVKEAVHELGHTYGKEHCSDGTCVMFFSNSLQDTDKKSSYYCAKCIITETEGH